MRQVGKQPVQLPNLRTAWTAVGVTVQRAAHARRPARGQAHAPRRCRQCARSEEAPAGQAQHTMLFKGCAQAAWHFGPCCKRRRHPWPARKHLPACCWITLPGKPSQPCTGYPAEEPLMSRTRILSGRTNIRKYFFWRTWGRNGCSASSGRGALVRRRGAPPRRQNGSLCRRGLSRRGGRLRAHVPRRRRQRRLLLGLKVGAAAAAARRSCACSSRCSPAAAAAPPARAPAVRAVRQTLVIACLFHSITQPLSAAFWLWSNTLLRQRATCDGMPKDVHPSRSPCRLYTRTERPCR